MAKQLQHIPDLAEILYLKGITDVVISPGSRNAPLIKAFYKRFGKKCRSIVDERSAAYFALGQSLASKKPTVLISTSGSAILNYAPAISEAFHQQIPMLILTADRPQEWIGQQDNQAINQVNIFDNYCKASFSLPTEILCNDDLWYSHRIINEAFQLTISENPGPVHINIPLREPLYEELPTVSESIRIISKEKTEINLNKNSSLLELWETSKSIMIVCGQYLPSENLAKAIGNLSEDSRVIIIAEPVSNLHQKTSISNPEIVFNTKKYPEIAEPELVIYFGGQVISRKIKLFLRRLQKSTFYHISRNNQIIDTFQNVNTIIQAEVDSVLKELKVQIAREKSGFKIFWEKENIKARQLTTEYIAKTYYSDLYVFHQISENLPDDAVIFAGNSSVVRYLIYFKQKKRTVYSNRGVSGIDGCLSSAVGLASKIKETVYVIVGDLTFIYDSNALWNRNFPNNLKIILINNAGGGIFHLLKGPSESNDFLPFVNAYHPVDFKKLAEAFQINYQVNTTEKKLVPSLKKLIAINGAILLEIKTPNNGEPQVTKDFFKLLNIQYDEKLGND